LKIQDYTDAYNHLNDTGNDTEEEGPEFMTVNMVCLTVAWEAFYRGVLDGADLAGHLCSHTPQAHQPEAQWMGEEHSTT